MKLKTLVVVAVSLTLAAVVYGAGTVGMSKDNMARMCSREAGLCGLEMRSITKGSVLLGYTRDKGDKPTFLHVHVFRLSEKPDKGAKIRVLLYGPGDPAQGKVVGFMRHGPGEYKTRITWDISQARELAARIMRRGMKDEVVYFKLSPGMTPEAR